MISVSCYISFECDSTTTENRYQDDFNASEVPSAFYIDVADVNGADVYEPQSEYYLFSSTESDNSTNGNIGLKEM